MNIQTNVSISQNVLPNAAKGVPEDSGNNESQSEDGSLDPADSKWSVKALTDRIPDLSVVIDLTNTNKYYHRKALTKINPDIQYNKIYTEGHVVPSRKIVKE